MIQAMYSGISGLKALKTQMDVIGNNIANVNTVGFKAGRVSFQELLSNTIRGATAPKGNRGGSNAWQIGLGVTLGAIDRLQSQGPLQATGQDMDVAIEGGGFFVVGDGEGKFYTRDGGLALDASHNLVSKSTGMLVLGWMADPISGQMDNSVAVTPQSCLNIPLGNMTIARQTGLVSLAGNLNAKAEGGDTCLCTARIYDSLGVDHLVSVSFRRTDVAATWDWEATSQETDPPGAVVGSGTITFAENGSPNETTGSGSLTLDAANGSAMPLDFTFSFDSVMQLSEPSSVLMTYQDGLPAGTLESFTIENDGVLSGAFSNGQAQPLAQIAMASFNNPAGLVRAYGNYLTESPNSGVAQVGSPASGNRGLLAAGYLESANVDLATEFANMIIAQRGFQANARVITTSDEMLQELAQLRR